MRHIERTPIEYLSRIGKPFVEHGCVLEMVRTFRAAGMPLADREIPSMEPFADDVEKLGGGDATPWFRLGDTTRQATRLLDVVLTRDPSSVQPHIFTCIDAAAGLFISNDQRRGVRVFQRRVIPTDCILGVYRLRRLLLT